MAVIRTKYACVYCDFVDSSNQYFNYLQLQIHCRKNNYALAITMHKAGHFSLIIHYILNMLEKYEEESVNMSLMEVKQL
jgi:hypothetical protein